MVTKKLLDQKHGCYQAEKWEKYQALYEGGDAFKKLLPKFLPKRPEEKPVKYQYRLDQAFYRSLMNGAINQFPAQLFQAPFAVRAVNAQREAVEPDDFYTQFKEDCDGKGTDLVDFLREVVKEAMVKKLCWAVAEFPRGQEQRATLSAGEYQSRGLGRAIVKMVRPDDVYDWETDEYGRLVWVLAHSETRKRMGIDQARGGQVTETWTLYDAQDVTVYQVSYDPSKPPKDDAPIPQVDRYAHGYAEVPVLCLELPIGLWIADIGADAQLQHFRMSNFLGYALGQTCFPVPVMKVEPDNEPPKPGPGDALMMGPTEGLSFAGPSAESFDVLAREVDKQELVFYRLCHQGNLANENSEAAAGRSADSKIQDDMATEVFLHAVASHVKDFVERLYSLNSAGRGETYTWSVEGLNTFRVSAASDVVAVTAQALMIGVQSPTFIRELHKKVVSVTLDDNLIQSTKDKINSEIDASNPELTPLRSPGFNNEQGSTNQQTSGNADSTNGAPDIAKELPRPNGARETNQRRN